MILGRVTGTVTATAKQSALTGAKLLIVATGEGEIVALDTVGAGTGDEVLVTTGSAARMPQAASGAPVDASIVAIVDAVTRS